MNKKILIIVIVSLVLVIFAINELRFFVWGPFGVPEQPTKPNCGESRYKYDLQINSKEDFLSALNILKNKDWSNDREGFLIAQWVMGPTENYSLEDVNVRTSSSLLSYNKLYSVKIKNPECHNSLTLEISEKGYASLNGCCGI